MPSRSALTRIAAAGALIAFAAVLFLLSDPDTPGWVQSVAGGGLAKVACAVIALVVTYVLLLLLGMGLARGEHVKRLSLRNLEFEFADEAASLKEIDVRLTNDMQALTKLVSDLAARIDELDEQKGVKTEVGS